MQSKIRTLMALTVALLSITPGLIQAVPIYNATETAIFGSGNPDTNWVEDTNAGVTTNIRLKERFTANMANDGAGTYTFGLGTSVNVEWSGSSGTTGPVGQYLWVLSFDTDPSPGTIWASFPVSLAPDNSFGTASTPNGAGVEIPYGIGAATYSVFQNSWRTGLVPGGLGLDPNVNASYQLAFTAYRSNDTALSSPISRAEATLQFGSSSVPDTGTTIGLLALSMLGLMCVKHKFGVA